MRLSTWYVGARFQESLFSDCVCMCGWCLPSRGAWRVTFKRPAGRSLDLHATSSRVREALAPPELVARSTPPRVPPIHENEIYLVTGGGVTAWVPCESCVWVSGGGGCMKREPWGGRSLCECACVRMRACRCWVRWSHHSTHLLSS